MYSDLGSGRFKVKPKAESASSTLAPPLYIGDRVVWRNPEEIDLESGIIRWIGQITQGSDEIYAGVEFDNPHIGNSDGKINGLRFFRCPGKGARFILLQELMLEEKNSLSEPQNIPRRGSFQLPRAANSPKSSPGSPGSQKGEYLSRSPQQHPHIGQLRRQFDQTSLDLPYDGGPGSRKGSGASLDGRIFTQFGYTQTPTPTDDEIPINLDRKSSLRHELSEERRKRDDQIFSCSCPPLNHSPLCPNSPNPRGQGAKQEDSFDSYSESDPSLKGQTQGKLIKHFHRDFISSTSERFGVGNEVTWIQNGIKIDKGVIRWIGYIKNDRTAKAIVDFRNKRLFPQPFELQGTFVALGCQASHGNLVNVNELISSEFTSIEEQLKHDYKMPL